MFFVFIRKLKILRHNIELWCLSLSSSSAGLVMVGLSVFPERDVRKQLFVRHHPLINAY